MRKRFQEQEEQKEVSELDEVVNFNPFEEVMFVEEHNFYDPGL